VALSAHTALWPLWPLPRVCPSIVVVVFSARYCSEGVPQSSFASSHLAPLPSLRASRSSQRIPLPAKSCSRTFPDRQVLPSRQASLALNFLDSYLLLKFVTNSDTGPIKSSHGCSDTGNMRKLDRFMGEPL
jgi:hypothetical protein